MKLWSYLMKVMCFAIILASSLSPIRATAGGLFNPAGETSLVGDLSGATAITIVTSGTPPTIVVTGGSSDGTQNGIIRNVGGIDVAVFCFDSVNLSTGTVTTTGTRPLALLSKADMTIGVNIALNGLAGFNDTFPSGVYPRTNAGGSGGAGGFSGGDIIFTDAATYSGTSGLGTGGGFGAQDNRGQGGSFGGRGGLGNTSIGGTTGTVYGDYLLSALQGGSGGGCGSCNNGINQSGGGGGGAMALESSGTLTINTGVTLSANGAAQSSINTTSTYSGGGGGAGGAIRLSAVNIALNGALSANGGVGGSNTNNFATVYGGGGGGGGRIAIYYSGAFTGSGAVTVTAGAKGASGYSTIVQNGEPGAKGTVYVQKDGFAPANTVYARFNPADFTAIGSLTRGQSLNTLDTDACLATITGATVARGMHVMTSSGTLVAVFPFSSFYLSNTPTVTGSYPLAILSQSDLTIGANFAANGGGGGDLVEGFGLAGGGKGGHCVLETSVNSSSNGGGAGGSAGYNDAGTGGAGYGGAGGTGQLPNGTAGVAYGSAPLYDLLAGSGAGASNRKGGAAGGGGIELAAAGVLTIMPAVTVSANGGVGGGDAGANFNAAGGGSGGSVLLSAPYMTINGTVQANGGDGAGVTSTGIYGGGGGGGGRIAVYSNAAPAMGAAAVLSVAPGLPRGTANPGLAGTTGTIYLPGSLSVSRDPVKMRSAVNVTPLTTTFTIKNQSAGTRQVQSVTVTNPGTPAVFSLTSVTDAFGTPLVMPYTMAVGEVITANVSFDRSTVVNTSGVITILSDDPIAPSITVTLLGWTDAAADWFVTPDGFPGGANPGIFRSHPVTTIQNAVAQYQTGDVIYMLKGVYTQYNPLQPATTITIYGGFDGSENQGGKLGLPSDRIATFMVDNPTTLTGNNTVRVFNIASAGAVVLDGLAMSYGYYGGSGGAFAAAGTNVTMNQCAFQYNWSNNTGITGGGAIYFTDATKALTLTRCVFTSNTSTYSGGAIYCTAQVNMTSCTFLGNLAVNSGGVIRIDGGSLLVTGCLFDHNNTPADGGAIFIRNSNVPSTATACVFNANYVTGNGGVYYIFNGANSSAAAINCLFTKNQAGATGGVIYSPGNTQGVKFINCTLVNNFTTNANMEDGLYLDNGAGLANNLVLNCIFDGHRIAVDTDGAAPLVTVVNSLTGINTPNTLVDCQTVGTIAADPAFVNTAGGNYHLQNYSPAIGAGAASSGAWIAPATDIEGTLRGTPVDIGAYENSLNSPSPGAPAADVRYAKVGGVGDGSSWANAATLVNAIANVSTGGIVFVSNESHSIVQTITITKAMSIYGGCVPNVTTTATLGVANGRPVNFMSNPTTVTAGRLCRAFLVQSIGYLILDGVNVANGYSIGDGAGLFSYANVQLTIRNCVFTNNSAWGATVARGGGLYTTGTPNLIVDNCTFFNNTAGGTLSGGGGGGGAIYGDMVGAGTLTNCTITSNASSFQGGAIAQTGGPIKMTNCLVTSNTSLSDGGAINITGTTTAEYYSCVFYGNATSVLAAAGSGGAIYHTGGTMTVDGCSFDNNYAKRTAAGGGGAISFTKAATALTVTRSSFTSNTATYVSGAVYVASGYATFTTCTFVKSNGIASGGALRIDAGYLICTACIFDLNITASSGGVLQLRNSNTPTTFTRCLFTRNMSTSTGGVFFVNNNTPTANSPLTAINCVFKDNFSTGAGTVVNAASDTGGVQMINCTFVNNRQAGANFYDCLYLPNNAPTKNVVMNCIFAGHRLAVKSSGNGDLINVANCLTSPDGANLIVDAQPVNCIAANPGFISATNLHLQNGSPAIGAGAQAFAGYIAPADDYDSQSRPQPLGSAPDIGAYENALGAPSGNPPDITADMYVKVNGVGAGTSWADATTLANALANVTAGGVIFMARGSHDMMAEGSITRAMRIYGGFVGDGSEAGLNDRNPALLWSDNVTTVNGRSANRCFNINVADSVTFDGFSIENGLYNSNNWGGGIYCVSAFLTLDRCIVANNKTQTGTASMGGGIGCSGGFLTIKRSRIDSNTANYAGGGIHYNGAGRVMISASTLINNQVISTGAGGAVRLDGASTLLVEDSCFQANKNITGWNGTCIYVRNSAPLVVLRRSRFTYNSGLGTTSGGGGAVIQFFTSIATQLTAENCLFDNNTAYGPGVVAFADGNTLGLRFVHCTFANNVQSGGTPANYTGLYLYANVGMQDKNLLVNCLFSGGATETAVDASTNTAGTYARAYNCLFGGMAVLNCENNNPAAGTALFLGSGADPYQLQVGSDGINTGMTPAQLAANATLTLAGLTIPLQDKVYNWRLVSAAGLPDDGAYELAQPNITLSPNPFHFGIVNAGASVTSNIALSNQGNITYTFDAAKWAVTGAPFALVTSFTGMLLPDTNAVMTLRFSPATLGDYVGSLDYTDVAVPLASAVLRGATPVSIISLTRMDSDPTSAGAVQWLATFTQPVVNVDLTDFDLVTTGAFTGAPALQSVIPGGATVVVTANTGIGVGQIQLVLNAASDIAEATYLTPLTNKPFAGEIYNLDNQAPVVISIIPRDGASAPTSATSVIYDVTFSKPVWGVAQANFAFVSLDGFASGSITAVSNVGGTPSATVWQVTVGNLISTNATGGYLQLNLTDPAGIADLMGNPMTVTATGGIIWVDSVAPTFDPMANVDPTSGSVVGTVVATTITFSEPVTGVTADKLVITSGGQTWWATGVANSSGDQKTYAFAINDVFGSGPVVLNIALYGTSGSTILDAAGNAFALAQWSIIKDATIIQVTIASAQVSDGGLTSRTQVNFHAHFLIAVAGFDPETQPGDLQLNNCAYVPGSLSGSGTDYDFAVSPLGDGAATVRIPANVCQTAIPPTRSNGTSNLYDLIFDRTPPAFTLLSALPARVQVGTTVTLSLTASEVLMADPLVTVNGHAATSTSKAGNNYTYTYIVVSGDPETTATIAMTGTDLTGNTSTTVNNTALYVDKTAPVATIEPVSIDGGALVTVDFSEDVTGVDVTDFILTKDGAPYPGIINFTIVNGHQVTFNVPNSQPGRYVLTLQAAGSNIRDLAGIPLAGDASDTWTIAEGASAVRLWSRY
ncbi:MAG: hypothetical protein NTX50_26950 [Candidatus Sumerlaeota bacterium]|nr:hypothetical protein [Candidatus Sumerlaeota bacterium]